MRIGELAGLVGISTRAVRHYHKLDVLPEPSRLANGYREYTLRDAVVLARVKRLTELGLSLGEVREVIASDAKTNLRVLLAELDADLASQEEEIRRRRARLADLLRRESLHPDDPVSDGVAALLGNLPDGASGLAAREREWLALLDSSIGDAPRREIADLANALAADPDYPDRMRRFYQAMDELEDADPDDPRIGVLAAELAESLPRGLLGLLPPAAAPRAAHTARDFLEELSPAQAEVVRRAFSVLAGE
ncbi:MerR family transcriptional regulator [Prauserella cavernicola]|uniref:MerR family transcriptional regulator n=1 Tax=Prauserella cavernicola TaxID=2800127 RepID=A0A934QZ73_9PSEU|nr:MerR family transcriptional regulator [Prauserella cavernicola]MBK1787973.1 MerR family transcriptional regulator [Prauserella cavernicola]